MKEESRPRVLPIPFHRIGNHADRESYLRHIGRYSAISISLNSAKQTNFEESFACLKETIAKEYLKYEYL